MNRTAYTHWQRSFLLEVALAAVFGGGLFVLLIVVTGGVLVSVLTSVAAMLLFGLLHYGFWGHVASRNVAEKRAQEQAQVLSESETSPADEVTLALSEPERLELVRVLERSLVQNAVGLRQPSRANQEGSQPDATVIRGLLDKLRVFGA